MSTTTRKGDRVRRGQKYQNSTAYKPGLYGESRRVKLAAALPLAGVCVRCKEKIEWKKKYDKYKPLTVPKKCVICQQKKIKQAYHSLCQDCAESRHVCAKCGEKEDVVCSFPLSKEAQAQEEAVFKQDLKLLTERERRKLFREQLKGKEGKATKLCTAQKTNITSGCDGERSHVTTGTDTLCSHVTNDNDTTKLAVQTLSEVETECS